MCFNYIFHDNENGNHCQCEKNYLPKMSYSLSETNEKIWRKENTLNSLESKFVTFPIAMTICHANNVSEYLLVS